MPKKSTGGKQPVEGNRGPVSPSPKPPANTMSGLSRSGIELDPWIYVQCFVQGCENTVTMRQTDFEDNGARPCLDCQNRMDLETLNRFDAPDESREEAEAEDVFEIARQCLEAIRAERDQAVRERDQFRDLAREIVRAAEQEADTAKFLRRVLRALNERGLSMSDF